MARTAKGVADSLEDENKKMKILLKKFKILTKNQMTEINQFNAGVNPDMAYKLKETQDEVKAKNKALDISEKSREDLSKKVEEKESTRAEAEANAIRLSKIVDTLQKSHIDETVRDKSKIKSRYASKPGGCQRADCAFLHSVLNNKSTDCDFWLAGKCRYSDEHCRYKHDPTKKGTDKSKQKKRESDRNSYEPASRQENVMVQPSQRMEGQRSPVRETNSRMESRSVLVERLRDLVQPATEVRRSEDRLTEAVRMILQIAGQEGRR